MLLIFSTCAILTATGKLGLFLPCSMSHKWLCVMPHLSASSFWLIPKASRLSLIFKLSPPFVSLYYTYYYVINVMSTTFYVFNVIIYVYMHSAYYTYRSLSVYHLLFYQASRPVPLYHLICWQVYLCFDTPLLQGLLLTSQYHHYSYL